MPRSADPHRAMRSDAHRNYQRLLAAAEGVFGESGADASLEEVARRAGVGIGTLYRHFPTRKALLEAMLRGGIDALEIRAEELITAEDSAAALAEWMRALRDHATRYRGLSAALMVDLLDENSGVAATCGSMLQAATALLHRAQHEGTVRGDVTIGDAVTMVNAVAWSVEQSATGAEQGERVFELMMDALRCVEAERRHHAQPVRRNRAVGGIAP
ncbi:TetR/AcrR family transcriptional regulator [Streptomyces tsukubensis]|uniref:TetR/AcrR family transcriptional regulator n=1 Tax=Streptomyces tsukubensis TaxID=83656 RepID=UPI0034508195